MKKFFKTFVVFFAILTLCLSIAGCDLFIKNKGSIDEIPDSAILRENVTFNEQASDERVLYTNDADVAEKVARSVVAIEISITNGTQASGSSGSGVIIDVDTGEEGVYYMLTCHHVISKMGSITISIPDKNGRNFSDSDYDTNYQLKGVIGGAVNKNSAVSLVGGDKDGDIAVLRLNTKGITDKYGQSLSIVKATVAGENTTVRYGEKVFAIGNPSGELPMTFMSGNISYLGRETIVGEVGIMKLYQHDVMINHGSSGGGLFNMYGELIGITNAGNDEFPGLNYAIPFKGEDSFVNSAKELIATATSNNYGYVTGRWEIGITIEEKTSGDVCIISVANGSNAMKAGLNTNDVIQAIKYNDGTKDVVVEIAGASTLKSAIYEMKEVLKVGDEFKMEIYRSFYGKMTIDVKLDVNFIFCDTGYYVS